MSCVREEGILIDEKLGREEGRQVEKKVKKKSVSNFLKNPYKFNMGIEQMIAFTDLTKEEITKLVQNRDFRV
jgi:hypothetical protein